MNACSRFFPKLSLSIEDFPVPRKLTISHTEEKTYPGDKQLKLLVYFVGEPKHLVVNLTNFKAISKIAKSDEPADWPGVTVVGFNDENVQFKGETTGEIRIRAVRVPSAPVNTPPAAPAPAAPAPVPQPAPAIDPAVAAESLAASLDDSVPF